MPMIDITSSNGKKNEAARSEPVAPAMSRMAIKIADRIAQRKGHVMLLVPKSVLICLLGAKSDSPLERLDTMNSNMVDSAAKVASMPIPFAVETDLPARKEETARVGSCEKSTKPASVEVAEICVLLKLDMFEDMDACANKAAKEVAKTMAAEAYSLTEKIKRLVSELVALKGFNISAPTSLQLETASHEIVDLNTRLDAIQIQDLEFAVSELRFAAYAKDEELIAAYNQVIHFKRIIDRLEPQVLELQGVLKINESLKNEVDELQCIRVGLLEKNEHMKVGEVSAQAGVTEGEVSDDVAAKSVEAAEGVATE
ncbi:hypothetical protein FF1_028052 [Malus domestica]